MAIDALTRSMIRTRADETAAEHGCRFNARRAERVRRFFREFLQHSKGEFAGKPFELLPWQWEDLFAPLFGWEKPDGTRRFSRAYVEISKKNGKSTIAAGVGLYLLVGDKEPGAEVYSTAVTREQAQVVHNEAVCMVRSSPGLSAYLRVNRSTSAIHFDRNNGVYRALTSDPNSQEGKNAHGLIADELHAWKGKVGFEFYQSVEYAGRGRRQPLFFQITTAGDDTRTVCYEQHQYARDVLRGVVKDDTRFFAYLRAAEPEDDLDDPAVWKKANPSLGVTIREDNFAAELGAAKKTPRAWNSFKRYSFGVWTTGSNPALSQEDWAACRAEFAEADLAGRSCWAALDLARVRDMTALALVFDGEAEGEARVLCYFWLPRGTLAAAETPADFRAWEREGWIHATEGDVTDYRAVEEKLVELARRFDVRELAYDPFCAEELTQRFEERTDVPRVSFAQTVVNFAGPTSEFERMVVAHQLRHDGNPVLAWQAGNVEWAVDRNNNKRPVKPGGRELKKIDGIVAAIMALGRRMQDGGAGSESGGLVL